MVPSDLLVGMCGIISDGQPALMQAGGWGPSPEVTSLGPGRTIRTGAGLFALEEVCLRGQKIRSAFPAVPVWALRPVHAV